MRRSRSTKRTWPATRGWRAKALVPPLANRKHLARPPTINCASIRLYTFSAKVEESEAQVDQHQEAQPTEEGNPSEAESSLDDDDGLYIPSYLEEVAPNDPVLQVRLARAMRAHEKETRRCYRCHQQGHLHKDCKEPEEKNGRGPLSSKGPLSAKSVQEKTKLRTSQHGRATPPTNLPK